MVTLRVMIRWHSLSSASWRSIRAALGGFLFVNTLYLQAVRGLPALHAGLYTLPTAVMMIVFAPISGRLTGRHGARPSIAYAAVSGMPPSQAAVASAVATTSRQAGITLGVAVLGTIAGARTGSRVGPGFTAATHPGWWIIAVLGLMIAALGYLTTTSWACETAQQTAKRLQQPQQ